MRSLEVMGLDEQALRAVSVHLLLYTLVLSVLFLDLGYDRIIYGLSAGLTMIMKVFVMMADAIKTTVRRTRFVPKWLAAILFSIHGAACIYLDMPAFAFFWFFGWIVDELHQFVQAENRKEKSQK